MEFVRHRVFSFAQESTRYCNYSKDKFGNELTFIIPCWMNIPTNCQYSLFENTGAYMIRCSEEGYEGSSGANCFLHACLKSEQDYIFLLNSGWKPQQARAVLPNALKTELVMTGFVSDWEHFFGLRCAANAHPQARELAIPLSDEFKKRNLL